MTCECGMKMKCRYSVPIGKTIRYRAYKCMFCGDWKDSLEMLESTMEESNMPEIRKRLAAAKNRRMGLIMGLRKKKG